MAVCRIQKNNNYTVMCNYHLKDMRLSLKAKGLLSYMLSLPDDWDYTIAGLTTILREGKDSIRAAVSELEACGYITRERERNEHGFLCGMEYVIREIPVEAEDNDSESSDDSNSNNSESEPVKTKGNAPVVKGKARYRLKKKAEAQKVTNVDIDSDCSEPDEALYETTSAPNIDENFDIPIDSDYFVSDAFEEELKAFDEDEAKTGDLFLEEATEAPFETMTSYEGSVEKVTGQATTKEKKHTVPVAVNPMSGYPTSENPTQVNPPQLNTNILNTKELNTKKQNTNQYLSISSSLRDKDIDTKRGFKQQSREEEDLTPQEPDFEFFNLYDNSVPTNDPNEKIVTDVIKSVSFDRTAVYNSGKRVHKENVLSAIKSLSHRALVEIVNRVLNSDVKICNMTAYFANCFYNQAVADKSKSEYKQACKSREQKKHKKNSSYSLKAYEELSYYGVF